MKCGKCNISINQSEQKKDDNYVKCGVGHAVCLNCWHEYISDVLEHKLFSFYCCAKVNPICKSTYCVNTLVNHLSLREYRIFMELYGDSYGSLLNQIFPLIAPSIVKRQDYCVSLPFPYPKNWYIIALFM
jgi:hypothetical protein